MPTRPPLRHCSFVIGHSLVIASLVTGHFRPYQRPPLHLMFTPILKERQSKIDWLLLLGVGGLMLIGVAFIYSATMVNDTTTALPWYRQQFFMQCVWYAFGLAAAAVICLIDYHVLARWALVAYWGTILLLVL